MYVRQACFALIMILCVYLPGAAAAVNSPLADNASSRDLIGAYTFSWGEWDSGDVTMWRHEKAAYLEFYHSRAGTKKFAVVALDKNDRDAPTRIWKELNGGR